MRTTRRIIVIAMLVALASLATPAYALPEGITGNGTLDAVNALGETLDGKGIGWPTLGIG